MHLDFAVVADYAIVDQAGKLSVLGIFHHIWVQQFPAMHPRLHLLLRLKGKRTAVGEHRVPIRLLDATDREILGGSGKVTLRDHPAAPPDVEPEPSLACDAPRKWRARWRTPTTTWCPTWMGSRTSTSRSPTSPPPPC